MLLLTGIGAGLGYLQGKDVKTALIGATTGMIVDWLLKKNPITRRVSGGGLDRIKY